MFQRLFTVRRLATAVRLRATKTIYAAGSNQQAAGTVAAARFGPADHPLKTNARSGHKPGKDSNVDAVAFTGSNSHGHKATSDVYAGTADPETAHRALQRGNELRDMLHDNPMFEEFTDANIKQEHPHTVAKRNEDRIWRSGRESHAVERSPSLRPSRQEIEHEMKTGSHRPNSAAMHKPPKPPAVHAFYQLVPPEQRGRALSTKSHTPTSSWVDTVDDIPVKLHTPVTDFGNVPRRSRVHQDTKHASERPPIDDGAHRKAEIASETKLKAAPSPPFQGAQPRQSPSQQVHQQKASDSIRVDSRDVGDAAEGEHRDYDQHSTGKSGRGRPRKASTRDETAQAAGGSVDVSQDDPAAALQEDVHRDSASKTKRGRKQAQQAQVDESAAIGTMRRSGVATTPDLASVGAQSVSKTGSKRTFATETSKAASGSYPVKSNVDKPRTDAERRGEGEDLDLPEGGYDDESEQVAVAWGDTINEQQHKLQHQQTERLEDPTMKQQEFGQRQSGQQRKQARRQDVQPLAGAFQDQTANVPTKESEV